MSEQGTPKSAKGIISESLISRVKNIILKPAAEWSVIDAEAADTRSIYLQYVALLAAIGAIASFIGQSLIGVTVPFMGTFRMPVVSGLVFAVVVYGLMFVAVFVLQQIINGLAPTFGGQKDTLRALKIAAYSSTPGWLGGIFNIVPSLAWIGALAGLYGIYLLYVGLPILMRSPKEKQIAYTATVAVIAIVVWVILGAIGGAIAGFGGYTPPLG
ncbi:MAG: Yip1 family protein [Alphaproteobacteria bacterium]